MKKFRDMTDSEKLEIINAAQNGLPLEVLKAGDNESGEWRQVRKRALVIGVDYFYRMPKKRPMSIDWSVLNDEYICAVNDIDGNGFAYREKPVKCQSGWISASPVCKLNGLKSYDPGEVNWQDSLIWRPGCEPK